MSASIVIPTTMRRETVTPAVEAALASLSGMEGGEVIVVANGRSEGRREIELRAPSLRVLECPRGSTPAARNHGVREARYDAILFTDDDCRVSREWAERMAVRLRDGAVATATSLRMRRDGPVTAFLDYQQVYHPPPIDGSTVRYPVGGSTGVRRDLIGVSFDEELFSGDDAEFGDRIREAGDSIVLVSDAPPPLHLMPETIDSIVGRFLRYGRGNAVRFLHRDRPSNSVPHVTAMYSSLCRNEFARQRRFEEIVDDGLREMFATFDLLLLASFLVGYLSEAGAILGREIVRADHDALAAGWAEIGDRLDPGAGHLDWDRLPVDFDLWATPRTGRFPTLAGAVADNLARHAPLAEPVRLDPDLDVWAGPAADRAEETWISSNRIWQELRGGELEAELEPIAARLGEEGIPFREGAQMIEMIAQGPVQPVTAATAGQRSAGG